MYASISAIILGIVLLLENFVPTNAYNTNARPKAGMINVHLVPHTHDDTGWLKTVDQYYSGSNNSIYHAGVQYILDSVMAALSVNPDRRFIYVEQAFFQRWWGEQDSTMKELVKSLVKSGQLEFINGGWCMHDEAGTHFVGMIDQTTLGHTVLKEQFNYIPTIGWQIDPFGHSATQASLLSAAVGFDALMFGRIDFDDRKKRIAEGRMEFMWRPSPSLGTSGQVWTSADFGGQYAAPRGFCYDQACTDPPIQDDQMLDGYNVKERVDAFVEAAQERAKSVLGDHVMFKMGEDFQYENAHLLFKNIDKLIHYVNLDGRVRTFYSTPTRYFEEKLKANLTWEVKTDDFFPYADCPNCYWTGYFTSRPALKRYIRVSSGYLQSVRHVNALYPSDNQKNSIMTLAKAVAVNQHHDAVAGTSKQHVAYDYAKRLSKGIDEAWNVASNGLKMAIGWSEADLTQCKRLNESICTSTSQSSSFGILLYNPIARNISTLVKVPIDTAITSSQIMVYDPNLQAIQFQIISQSNTIASSSLVFEASVQSLGHALYFVQSKSKQFGNKSNDGIYDINKESTSEYNTTINGVLNEPKDDIVLENTLYRLEFSSSGIATLTNKVSNLKMTIEQDIMFYESLFSDKKGFQNSGAYIFRPKQEKPIPVSAECTGEPLLESIQGKVVDEVTITLCPWAKQTFRLYHSIKQPYVELEYTIGPIPFEQGRGHEVISRWNTDIQSGDIFYTDSNGQEMQKRRKNFRPTWKLNVTEPVAGNYYPVNSAIYIKDSTRQLTVLTDRTQGGSSLNSGSLELMLHRRILHDDSRGVTEPLNETESITHDHTPRRLGRGLVITGKHYIMLTSPDQAASVWRPLAWRVFLEPIKAFTKIPSGGLNDLTKWIKDHKIISQHTATTGVLPINVELISLIPLPNSQLANMTIGDSKALLRLGHAFAVNEDQTLSKPVSIQLSDIFNTASFSITDAIEVSLTGNQHMREFRLRKQRLQEIRTSILANKHSAMQDMEAKTDEKLKVTLSPMQIKTYEITYKH